MRVRLKGLNRVTKRLADGSQATYYYAWNGGPRLPGKPGDPEFAAAYADAHAALAAMPEGVLQPVFEAYLASPKYTDLAPMTRKDDVKHVRKIAAEYSDFPVAALGSVCIQGIPL
jgi:hypothetical protein